MIAYLIGKVTEVSDDNIVVENNQIGFNVRVPYGYGFKIGSEVQIYTYTYVKEDAFQLYGFDTKDQLELFKKLITVNGIGPKGALAILSVMSANDLRFAIYSQDASAIAKAPGIGKKTAERVILDLKDKVRLEDINGLPGQLSEATDMVTGDFELARKDAVDALAALGYGVSEAAKAVSQVTVTEDMTAEEILKLALKFLF
ncbi:MAG: Holliday junction branch migration protein RuvA [Lachnospiraceae bacterium]